MRGKKGAARLAGGLCSATPASACMCALHKAGKRSEGVSLQPGAARGFTADLVILDEWAFQQYAEEIWASIFPVVNRPGGGRVIGLSTIRLGTLFEEIFTNPDNGFHKLFLPWYADPARGEAWYARTLGALGEDKTMQEYPASVEEALSVPGGAMFPEVRAETHICEERELRGTPEDMWP